MEQQSTCAALLACIIRQNNTDRIRQREKLDQIISTIRQNTCLYIYVYIYIFVCVCSFIYYVRHHYIFDVLMDGIQKFTLI